MKEMKRYYLIEQAIKGKMYLTQAARIMGISYRQALRLKKRVIAEGIKGIISKHRTPHNKIPEEIRNRVVDLYTDKYGLRLNILHFKEKFWIISKYGNATRINCHGIPINISSYSLLFNQYNFSINTILSGFKSQEVHSGRYILYCSFFISYSCSSNIP